MRAAGARWLLSLAAMFAAAPAAAQSSPDPVNNPTIDYDAPERERIDAQLPHPMPAIPATSALREFQAGATSPNTFGVDPASLNVRGKRIVQFTLVVTSPRGLRNIGYEALDCERGQVRLLATGRDGGGWSPVGAGSWRPVRNGDTVNGHYRELYRSWCDGGKLAGAPRELLRRLDAVPQRYLN